MGREIKIEYLVIYEDKPTTRTVFTLEQIEQGIMTIGSALGAVANGVKEIHRRQFTGLLDKDGEEVFEGDIIPYANSNGKAEYAEVVFECDKTYTAGFYLKYDGCLYNFHDEDDDEYAWFQVVGNIYENKELLDA